ncbi:hypothetical protein FN846DRAFT_971420 [Sphaerosporella brunnea]|uniref:non-specific serine/threonine protein kinase n=1 Tax=Sphaerosporella brunnea TaxID=1250544 RepID=A0A5J5EJ36_9PEZI|nr:hypothetical protein FN846DRAFT_971420 [Sphaerosporella brunnea]
MSLPPQSIASRTAALEPVYNFTRSQIPDLAAPLSADTLSDPTLLAALLRTLRLLVGCPGLSAPDLIAASDELSFASLRKREPQLRSLLVACAAYYLYPDGTDAWATVVKAVNAWLPPKLWSPQRPPPVRPGPPSGTPIKNNSHRHTFESTTRAVLDPLLRAELSGHLWTTVGDIFFDRFFPSTRAISPATHVPLFPRLPSESNVLQWLQACSDLYRSVCTERSDWIWRSACGQLLTHVDGQTERQPDVFLYPRSRYDGHDNNITAPADDAEWGYAALVAELKQRKGNTESQAQYILQLASFAKEVFATQPGRGFVHSFIIVNTTMRCWIWTRSGGIASRRIRLDKTDDLRLFWRIFCSYLQMTPQQLGYIGEPSSSQTVGKQNFDVDWDDLIDRDRAIVSRGTTVWGVRTPEGEAMPLVLKESWRYAERRHEGDLLELARQHNVQGIARHVAHDDGHQPTVHELLGNALVDAATPLDRKGAATENPPASKKRRASDFQLRTQSIKRSRGSPATASNETPAVGALDLDETEEYVAFPDRDRRIPNRIATRVVLERGIPITRWLTSGPSSHLSLLRSLRDAIRGHYSLLTAARILHRDISKNNIMMADPLHPRPDGYTGFLIDLDLALPLPDDDGAVAACGAPERTGTFEFLSVEALEWDPSKKNSDFLHCYYDDLQSFFWVFLYLCTENPETNEVIGDWRTSRRIAAQNKRLLLNDAEVFRDFLDGLLPVCRSRGWRDLLWRLREILFPGQRLARTEVQQLATLERLYTDIGAAFGKAIAELEKESA